MSDDEVVSAVQRVEEGDAGGDGDDAPDDAPAVEELVGPERRLHGRVRYLWGVRATLATLVLAVVVGVAAFALAGLLWPGVVTFAVLWAVGLALVVVRYRRWRYEVRDDSLLLDRGVYAHVRTVVPYVRIQHVDVSRGPFERALGLASVVVYTAGSRGADVTIPGLTPDRADDLQRRLKQLAIVADGEDAV